MPELPEVEAIRVWLDSRVYGRGLRGATLERLEVRHAVLGPFDLDLPRPVAGLVRWGKEIAVDLGDAGYLAVHLRMTGDLVAGDDEKARLVLWTSAGPVSLVDGRKLARVQLVDDGPNELGPDVLERPSSAAELRARIGGSKRAIKAALLDQSIVAGLGNIWVDEVLFEAKVHPGARSDEVELAEIARAIQVVVPRATDALLAKITAAAHGIEWIRHTEDEDALPAKVHRREGKPCPSCGQRVVKTKVAGRGTYLCPGCQPTARG